MLKLNVSLTKRTSDPDSPSCDASANLEADFDSDLINQPDLVQGHAHRLFRLANEALGRERDLRDAPDANQPAPRDSQHGGNHRRRRGRRASRRQMVEIHGLATRHEVDLDGLLRDKFRVCQIFEISVQEASELLDELKAMTTSIDNNVEATAD